MSASASCGHNANSDFVSTVPSGDICTAAKPLLDEIVSAQQEIVADD
jgi:hypothetical protein